MAPVPVRTIKVIVGDLNINSTSETHHQLVNISSITFHSHFDPYYLENDIAVIKLKSPLKFRSGIQPICLPEKGSTKKFRSFCFNFPSILYLLLFLLNYRELICGEESFGVRLGCGVLSPREVGH